VGVGEEGRRGPERAAGGGATAARPRDSAEGDRYSVVGRVLEGNIYTVVSQKIGPQKISKWGAKLKSITKSHRGGENITSIGGANLKKWANLLRHYGYIKYLMIVIK
jgi:hypothetical protein